MGKRTLSHGINGLRHGMYDISDGLGHGVHRAMAYVKVSMAYAGRHGIGHRVNGLTHGIGHESHSISHEAHGIGHGAHGASHETPHGLLYHVGYAIVPMGYAMAYIVPRRTSCHGVRQGIQGVR